MLLLCMPPPPLLPQVYRILLRHTAVVQPLSCDEAFLDLTGLPGDPQERVAQIRREIQETTSCTASAGEWEVFGTQSSDMSSWAVLRNIRLLHMILGTLCWT
jgi:hypothetical protein